MHFLKKFPVQEEVINTLKKENWSDLVLFSLFSEKDFASILKNPYPLLREKENLKYLQDIRKKNGQIDYFRKSDNTSWVLSTGSFNLDHILDGNGLVSQNITLVYGKYRTGKSQFAHQCCVQAFKQFERYNFPKVALFIDTEGTFRPERIKQMANYNKLSEDKILKSISVLRIQSISEFNHFLPKIQDEIEQNQIKILVIDSLTALFRVEIAKKEMDLYQIIQSFSKILRKLLDISIKLDIPILCTSQVTSSFDELHFFDVQPIFKTTLNVYVKQWILFVENEESGYNSTEYGIRFAHIINSQTKSEQIVRFKITNDGLMDFF